MHGWAPEVIGAVGTPHTSPEAYLDMFFTRSAASRQAGSEALRRMYARTKDRDQATSWATRGAQYDALCHSANRSLRRATNSSTDSAGRPVIFSTVSVTRS